MIVAAATSPEGERLVLLGITRENLTRLLLGNPMHIAANTHPGFPLGLSVSIFFGETERACVEAIQDLIGPDTRIVAAEPPSVN